MAAEIAEMNETVALLSIRKRAEFREKPHREYRRNSLIQQSNTQLP